MDLNETDWEGLLRVWMHDPFDKALDIPGHVGRARRYTKFALGPDLPEPMVPDRDAGLADQLASRSERLPMPKAGPDGALAVGPENSKLCRIHPLSGKEEELDCPEINEAAALEMIEDIVCDLDGSPKTHFLALWRQLPDKVGFPLNALPADTRVPDHSLIAHADITAGIWTSLEKGAGGGALLSFALGPVQPFIAAARSLRDLWTGSCILSRMAFAGMRPIVERLGPTAFVFPALRGNPLMDLWLRNEVGVTSLSKPCEQALRSPSLPHRFVALVPWGVEGATAHAFAEACKIAAHKEWHALSEKVRNELAGKIRNTGSDGWDRDWSAQCDVFFDVHTTVVPLRALDDGTVVQLSGGNDFAQTWPDATRVRALAGAIPSENRPGYTQNSAGLWQAQLDLSSRIMEAERMIRHVPVLSGAADAEQVAAKCSLFGSFEQMGAADFSEASHFWDSAIKYWNVKGTRLRKGERFSALALTKRFAMSVVLQEQLGLDEPQAFPDTATIAAADWLCEAGIKWAREQKWNGRWLHEVGQTLRKEGEEAAPEKIWKSIEEQRKKGNAPPAYYAILVMDGDDLGSWLRGDKLPEVGKIMHPKLRNWFARLQSDAAKDGLKARRPAGPALHASISAALGDFATRSAPRIVENYNGRVIYSGGDDLLAVMPARQAVACARELREAYRNGEEGLEGLGGMGCKATISAGLAFVHYKEDLRIALEAARAAESGAKKNGKDALVLRFMRRSGEHSEALLEWGRSEWFDDLTRLFFKGASSRWAYQLRMVQPILANSDAHPDMIAAEIRRLGDRAEEHEAWKSWNNGDAKKTPEKTSGKTRGMLIASWWSDYHQARQRRAQGFEQLTGIDKLLSDFIALCQGAAFVARGRDD